MEIINEERAKIMAEDSELSAAMKLVGGTPLTQNEARTVVKSGAFGNVFSGRISASYDVAQTNSQNINHWTPADALAADAANSPSVRKIIRQRARYESANNCYAKGMGESLALDLVGTGPSLHINDLRIPIEDRKIVENSFNDWLKKIKFAVKLRTMRRAKRLDGESFGVKINNNKLKHEVKLDIKLIETEMVATPNLALPDGRHIDGMDLDINGYVEYFHVRKGHPGDPGQSADAQQTVKIPASDMIHWFRQDRPGQHRGISEMTAGLPLYALLRRYNLAVVQAAETAADFAMFMRTTLGPDGMTDSDDDIIEVPNTFDLFPLQRNIVTTLPDGYDIGQTKPEQPTNAHKEFVISIIREIARNENISLNIALGDSGQGNFASGSLDHRIYFKPREVERSEINNYILDNLFEDWLFEAGLVGIVDVMNKSWTNVEHTWRWDSNELGEPLKLAGSKAIELKNGITTIPKVYADKNMDWRNEFTAAATSLGLTFEEYQEMVRDAIFAGKGAEQDTGDEEEDDDDNTKEPTRQQPQQNVARKANAK